MYETDYNKLHIFSIVRSKMVFALACLKSGRAVPPLLYHRLIGSFLLTQNNGMSSNGVVKCDEIQ